MTTLIPSSPAAETDVIGTISRRDQKLPAIAESFRGQDGVTAARTIACDTCSRPVESRRSTKRFCDVCLLARRCRKPVAEQRPAGIPAGQPFERQCHRCGAGIVALRASKRFCDECLQDHKKPVREQARSARAHKLRKFGLTLAQYDSMVAERGGRCDVCGQAPKNQGGSLCVDHDHETGVVRGLLCSPCNRAIGLLGDNVDGLTNALAYLMRASDVLPGKAPHAHYGEVNTWPVHVWDEAARRYGAAS